MAAAAAGVAMVVVRSGRMLRWARQSLVEVVETVFVVVQEVLTGGKTIWRSSASMMLRLLWRGGSVEPTQRQHEEVRNALFG